MPGADSRADLEASTMPKRSPARPPARPSARRRIALQLSVEAVEARRLLATLTVNTTDNSGYATTQLSLAQAIQITNGTLDPTTLSGAAQAQIVGSLSAPNTIVFNLPGTGLQTITASSTYDITAPVTIDGYTQSDAKANTLAVGDNAVLRVQLTPAVEGPSDGINIDSGGVTLQGLVINGYSGNGIVISPAVGNTGNVIRGNFLGTDATGTSAVPNDSGGISVQADANTIGGASAAARNVISGAVSSVGIDLSGAGNIVQGNYVGTSASGLAALPNQTGILASGAGNTIGGALALAGNVVSGNDGVGISVTGTGNAVQGNFVGVDATGAIALGNGAGILVSASGNTLGGPSVLARNVVSGNSSVGIDLAGIGNIVQGNYVGTDAAGSAALPNYGSGVQIEAFATANTIGGATRAAGNLISGNYGDGVSIYAANSVIQSNFIGTDAAGAVALGNGGDGVYIPDTNNNVVGPGNLIADNSRNGITIGNNSSTTISGNAVIGNSITGNAGLGIDLGNDGVTPNTPGGPHIGPNQFQNYPVLTTAYDVHDGTVVTGTLNSTPSSTFTIQLYANLAADPSGYGQGRTSLVTTVAPITVTTDASGNAAFTATIASGAPALSFLSATATDSGNNTSEFSADLQVVDAFTVTNTGNAGPGSLRQAILNADSHAGVDTIRFAIPGSGVQVIAPTQALPAVSDPTILDARTQPGYAGTPLIEIDGGGISALGTDGLVITGGNSRVSGLSIVRFTNAGLVLDGAGQTLVTANYLGLTPGGLAAGNQGDGLDIFGSVGNYIGGLTAADRNVISANGSSGIDIEDGGDSVSGYTVSSGNVIAGNTIGLDPTGASARGNAIDGVAIGGSSTFNAVGSGLAAGGNLISGNGGFGIDLFDGVTSTYIQSNAIGVDATGLIGLGNRSGGIDLQGASLTNIGDNIISANGGDGIDLYGPDATGNYLYRNRIGVDATNQAPLGNNGSGIALFGSSRNAIGDLNGSTADRNVVTGNVLYGILLSSYSPEGGGTFTSDGNFIAGNFLGQAGGFASPGNGRSGVRIDGGSSGNEVRSNLVGNNNVTEVGAGIDLTDQGTAGNVILGNTLQTNVDYGIIVAGGATSNLVLSNTILSTGGLGIGVRLGGAGTSGNAVQGNTIEFNAGAGVVTDQGASGNFLGGTGPGAGNTIASNGGPGVIVRDAGTIGNLVQGNDILGNRTYGVEITLGASGTLVGGTAPGSVNIIGNTAGIGLAIDGPGTTGNAVQGNLIGVDMGGTALPNQLQGVALFDSAAGNLIGGTAQGAGNVISGNLGVGIQLGGFIRGAAVRPLIGYDSSVPQSPSNLIQGNRIGTSPDGLRPVGNGSAASLPAGILFAPGTTGQVGGLEPGAGNLIADNFGPGVYVSVDAEEVTILSNSIVNNLNGGIILENASPISGNNNQPAPAFTIAPGGGSTAILSGTATGAPNSAVAVQFFTNVAPDPSGYGQGQALLTTIYLTTDSTGTATFHQPVSADAIAGLYVTATATNGGNTSEFSLAVAAGSVQFGSSTFLVNARGGDTFADVVVTRSGAANSTVSVAFATANGTAVAGVDYAATSGYLTFGPGQTTQTIEVPILDTLLLSGTSTFFVNLSNPLGGAVLGQQTTATVTIVQASNLVVTNTNDSGRGSLRRAIDLVNNPANAAFSPFDITFNIPGGVQVIRPLSALPTINYPVTIDGFSQPGSARNTLAIGNNGPPTIVLDGSGLPRGTNVSGLDLAGGGSVVQGLAIGGFPVAGIVLEFGGGNTVRGNFLGTDQTGTLPLPNGKDGIYVVDSSNNVIGGTTPDARNLISGNAEVGVLIQGNAPITRGAGIVQQDASNNIVLNNYVGTNASGLGALANGLDGVFVQDASANLIGQPGGSGGNLISGNGSVGVQLFGSLATRNLIQNNLIGSNAVATARLGNRADGVYLNQAPGNVVGGATPGQGNVIVANGFSGVDVFRSSANVIQGNLIGLLPGGVAAGNAAAGILLDNSTGNTVGGTGAAANTIGFNGFAGIQVVRDGRLIPVTAASGNTIGSNVLTSNTNPRGTAAARAKLAQGPHPKGAAAQVRATRPQVARLAHH